MCSKVGGAVQLEFFLLSIGMYKCSDSTAKVSHKCHSRCAAKVPVTNRKNALDGAANMSGRLNGIQAKLYEIQPM